MFKPIRPPKLGPPHFGHEESLGHQAIVPPPERSPRTANFTTVPPPERSGRPSSPPHPSKREHATVPISKNFSDRSRSTGPGFGGGLEAGTSPLSYSTPGD